jgi:glycosyltransferase involved in cell wall biosynthesis
MLQKTTRKINRFKTPGLIDVLCPVFNQGEYIAECIESIISQENVNLVLHIFDDASDDETPTVIDKYKSKYSSQIRVYRNLRNYGDPVKSIMANKPVFEGEYWTYIEGDDFVIGKDRFLNQIQILSTDLSLIGTATATELWSTRDNVKQILQPSVEKWSYLDLVENVGKHVMYAHVSSLMWKNTSRNNSRVFPIDFIRSTAFQSEILLFHIMLRDSKLAVNFMDYVGSCYRYTGKGIWSSLNKDQQKELNDFQDRALNEVLPRAFKFCNAVPFLGLSKIAFKLLGYEKINP